MITVFEGVYNIKKFVLLKVFCVSEDPYSKW